MNPSVEPPSPRLALARPTLAKRGVVSRAREKQSHRWCHPRRIREGDANGGGARSAGQRAHYHCGVRVRFLPLFLLLGCPTGDLDGDGVSAPQDCDDEDPSVFPGAAEVCDNGVDDNCDGAAPECRRLGSITLGAQFGGYVGPSAGAGFGSALATVGDVDGDGFG
ncbi:MAG: putative metal-binding motif-containing protein, partial [Deltaproteobacteria bacterium]|nr:putative metal-binding motif-containing protein [Deltaproteobacteria bacterium]